MEKEKAFVTRCKEFFGLHPGQTLQGFAHELGELTADDKAEMVKMFNDIGLPTRLSSLPAAQG